jgi:hypothetical protein
MRAIEDTGRWIGYLRVIVCPVVNYTKQQLDLEFMGKDVFEEIAPGQDQGRVTKRICGRSVTSINGIFELSMPNYSQRSGTSISSHDQGLKNGLFQSVVNVQITALAGQELLLLAQQKEGESMPAPEESP